MRFEAEKLNKIEPKLTVYLWMRRYCKNCKIAIQFERVGLNDSGDPACPVCGEYLYGSQTVHGMYSKKRIR